MAVSFFNQLTGKLPMRTSLNVPPPIAVAKEMISTPKGSSFFSIAKKAPDTAKEKPQKGIVVAVGPGKKDEPILVKVGDSVLYGKYAGTEIQIEGQDLLIMRESDLLAIV